MRLLALVLIGIIAVGGVIDACADAHPDHADLACVDACCQPVYPVAFSPALTAALALCGRLDCPGRNLNEDPLARSHFRPPEAV